MTRTAEILGYTQSGVSHLIASLEQELGVVLLERRKTGTQLTQEGSKILPYVKRLLSAEQDIHVVASNLRGLKAGELRIGTISSVAMSYLPGLLSGFQKKYPGVTISVYNETYANLETALSERRIDCAFVTLPSREEFSITPLIRDRLLAVVNQNSPLAGRTSVLPGELLSENFILPAEGSQYDIGKIFHALGKEPAVTMDMHDDFAALMMVRQGLGVTILPELMIKSLPMEDICTIPLENSERQIGIATSKVRADSPSIRAFLTFAKQNLKN